MNQIQQELVIGGLLHDIGKVLYRSADQKTHSESGYMFLKDEAGIDDQEILDQVRYHHAGAIKNAHLKQDSTAYITYIADNIASAVDRRKKEESAYGFIKDMPLESIFNILNNNHEDKVYAPSLMEVEKINYPTDKKVQYTEGFYRGVREKVKSCLTEFAWQKEYINSLLSILESTLSFIPSSTAKAEVADISLYDHVKLTAALGACIYQYAVEEGIVNYEKEFFTNAKDFYSRKAFGIYSIDISGIQDFIYTITSKAALKGLRSRSFYLEIMMEHLIDEILEKLELSRANLIYSGGGHAYILVANTEKTKDILRMYMDEVNVWLLGQFQTALYAADGFGECSAKDLWNEPDGSYKNVFRDISANVSEKKMHRYSGKQIMMLNHAGHEDGTRECRVCKRSSKLMKEDQCSVCYALEQMSSEIMKGTFFTVTRKEDAKSLPLPGDQYLITDTKESLLKRLKENDSDYVRSYSKNQMYSGYDISTRLWVGDYVKGNTFEDLAESAHGWKRIAVMRADVDDLGQAFVRGFESENGDGKYVTLSRTATFSRKLSMFFKYHINSLLKEGTYFLSDDQEENSRNAVIVYSGGDDVFIVGSWDDVIGFAIDLYKSLQEYSQDTLHISAGIGLYPAKYPISVMAKETGFLEDCAKAADGKNAVALFDENYVFHWNDFIDEVLEEKLRLLKDFFDEYKEMGNSFLYKVLQLIREREEKINLARYAYILGRFAPDPNKVSEEKKQIYDEFSRKMYRWIRNDKDAKQLEMAIYLYVYLKREENEHGI